jgi:fimbrial chaperone protein
MVSRRLSRPAVFLALALLAGAAPAFAAISLTPVQVELSPGKQSELIAVTNESDSELRLQVEIFAWEQRADGETLLQPTKDVLVFPPLLTIAAHEVKRIRVGATVPPAAAEKSYRLTVQELPNEAAEGAAAVKMLTKISIPVFLQPGPVKAQGRIEAEELRNGTLAVRVRNTGTRRFILGEVDAQGLDSAGKTVFDVKAAGWYVLAGGQRDYSLAISAAECRAARSIELRAKLDDQQIGATVQVLPNACGQAAKTQIGNLGP